MKRYNRNRRNLPDFRFGGEEGGGEGGGFAEVDDSEEGGEGGTGAASRFAGDGMEVGGAVWILLAVGFGGTRGTF